MSPAASLVELRWRLWVPARSLPQAMARASVLFRQAWRPEYRARMVYDGAEPPPPRCRGRGYSLHIDAGFQVVSVEDAATRAWSVVRPAIRRKSGGAVCEEWRQHGSSSRTIRFRLDPVAVRVAGSDGGTGRRRRIPRR